MVPNDAQTGSAGLQWRGLGGGRAVPGLEGEGRQEHGAPLHAAEGLVGHRPTSEAMDLRKEIRDENAAMSTVMHNSLIDTQAREGKVEGVGRLSVAMKDDGARVDACTYSTMVKSHCYRGDMPKA